MDTGVGDLATALEPLDEGGRGSGGGDVRPGAGVLATGSELLQADGAATVRVRLDLAYDGTAFSGWAAQPGLRTVEGEVTRAASLLLGGPVSLTVAGRTDAGVHARHQVTHLDTSAATWSDLGAGRSGGPGRPPGEVFVARMAGLLARGATDAGVGGPRGSSDVVVLGARIVAGDFDARFSALERHYAYRLCDSPSARDPLRRTDVWWLTRGTLDTSAMGQAAGTLLGEHDFLSFCRPREGATTIRTLTRLDVTREPDSGWVVVRVGADAFCHSMVRSLVGALVEVGLGRRGSDWPRALLEARSRTSAAPVAPACGLTLEGVDYPPEQEWAERARRARNRRGEGCC